MAARQHKTGACHICGNDGPLSFEHVPPRAAYNHRPASYAAIRELIGSTDLDNPVIERKQQRGGGAYTLCGKCNNNTGSWYGGAYVEWAGQAATILQGASGEPTLSYLFRIYLLRVIKQIVCMFFSKNSPHFRDTHPELVKLVLDKSARGLPDSVRIYAGYCVSDRSRSAGVTGMIDGLNASSHMYSEIAHPPFALIMTFDSPCPDTRMVDISFFARSPYERLRELDLRLPVLSVYTLFPGDYRPRDQVKGEMSRAGTQEIEG